MPSANDNLPSSGHGAVNDNATFWTLHGEYKNIVTAVQNDLDRLDKVLTFQFKKDVHKKIIDMEAHLFYNVSRSSTGAATDYSVREMTILRDGAKELKKSVDDEAAARAQLQPQTNGVNGH